MDSQNNLLQLKILGLGLQGDIGAAVAIEINGEIYAPYHDFRGNLIAIASIHKIIETYSYTAFGEEAQTNYINPWRFSSKRSDETLIYFGRRFYDPSIQRWL